MVPSNQIQLFGYGFGDFSTPQAALVSAVLLGFLMGAVPVGAAEVLSLLIAGLEPRSIVVPLLLVMTAGHVLGKLLWYWAGTPHHRIRQPWLRRQVDAGERFMRVRPRLGLGALVSLPPFHVTAIGAGVIRTSLLVFVLVAYAGRAVRFAAIATVPFLGPFLGPEGDVGGG
jgi:membrane protein YqaA with SNARE-associated domain